VGEKKVPVRDGILGRMGGALGGLRWQLRFEILGGSVFLRNEANLMVLYYSADGD